MNRLRALEQRWRASFAGRTLGRYSTARAGVLAGGIAYFAFFSVLPALAVGFTVLGLVLGRDRRLQDELVASVNSSLGTTVIGSNGDGIVPLDRLTQTSTLTVSAVLGLAGLLLTGLGWIGATREGIRAVFGTPGGGNAVLDKLRDLGVLVTLGLAILVSAVGSVVVTTASNGVLSRLGLEGTTGGGTLVGLVRTALIVGVDTMIFLVMFRVLAGVTVPVRHLWRGAFAGGIGLGLLKLFGGLVLELLSGDRLLAAFSVVVGLLVWMNLVARLTLLAASWAATRAADVGELPAERSVELPTVVPAEPPATGRGVAVRRAPSYGVRAADRTTLAAGVVLGVAGAAVLRVGRGALRSVVGAVRG